MTSGGTLNTVAALHDQLFDMLCEIDSAMRREGVSYFLAAGTALGAARSQDIIPWDFDLDLLVPVDQYQAACIALKRHLPQRYGLKDPKRDSQYEHLFARVFLEGVDQKYVHADLFPLGGTFSSRSAQRLHLRTSKVLRQLFYVKRRLARPEARVLTGWKIVLARAFTALVPDGGVIRLFDRMCSIVRAESARVVTNIAAGYMTRECVSAAVFQTVRYERIRHRRFPVPGDVDGYLRSLYGDYMEPPTRTDRARELKVFDDRYLPVLAGVPRQLGELSQDVTRTDHEGQ